MAPYIADMDAVVRLAAPHVHSVQTNVAAALLAITSTWSWHDASDELIRG